ncbi:glutaredoxin-C4 [Populus alba x Populus x berolinensis]|nr:glutaredoxin-C4 [Populus alba x Populus x berolinensis]
MILIKNFVALNKKNLAIYYLLCLFCRYCKRAKGVFKELNQTPHVVELDQREDGHNIQDAMSEIVGRRTVPQVFIDGKHIGGSDDTVEAYESGELAKLLGVASEQKDDL